MGLKCPCGNTGDINDLVSWGQTLGCIRAFLLAAYALILQAIAPLRER